MSGGDFQSLHEATCKAMSTYYKGDAWTPNVTISWTSRGWYVSLLRYQKQELKVVLEKAINADLLAALLEVAAKWLSKRKTDPARPMDVDSDELDDRVREEQDAALARVKAAAPVAL